MRITWYGLSCFRIAERGQANIVTDPYHSGLGLPALKLRADVVTISQAAPAHNDISAVSGFEHTLTAPGEYEIGGVFMTGIATHQTADEQPNVLYVFDYGGLTVAHLGGMTRVPSQTQIESLEQVNVLLVPVGGGGYLNAAQAAELVSMLEPNIVVPMHYRIPKVKIELDEVDRFLKEMGVNEPSEQDELQVTSGSLPEETETVILTAKV